MGLGMNHTRSSLLGCFAALVAACADPSPTPAVTTDIISPQDFALVPCGSEQAERPCALAIAGGKRILFGAPAGAAASMLKDDLQHLDAVIVFSLRAADIEGLDEVRNESWRAGRDQPLLTIGPRGILEVVDGLNKAFEQADALRIVEEGIPRGGYDAAVLTGRDAVPSQTVFDTGDVQVVRLTDGYQMSYNGAAAAVLLPCSDGPDGPSTIFGDVEARVLCEGTAPDLSWPLRATHFVVKNQTPE